MNNRKKTILWRGIAGLMAAVLTLVLGASAIAGLNSDFINMRIGTSNTKMVNSSGIYFQSEFTSLEDLVKAKEELAVQISAEGTVLLKNNGALPLDISKEAVTLWGMNSHTTTLGGMIGSSASYDPTTGQKAYGIEEALAERGFSVNETMKALYSSEAAMAYARASWGSIGHGLSPVFWMAYSNPEAYPIGEIPASMYTDDVLKSADGTAAVVVIGRDSSEAADYHPDMVNATEGDTFERPLALSQYERDMIALAKAHSDKVIVVINATNPVEIDELKHDAQIDAILWAGTPGMQGFLGVADVLSGTANPSGHLPDTFAANSTSAPAMQNFGLYTYTNFSMAESGAELTAENKADWFVVESEGIYVGYKYYETRYEDLVLGKGNASDAAGSSNGAEWSYSSEVSYPFGYGLSYTTFSQKLESVDVNVGGEGKAVVTVTNTGDKAGKSVVQLYVQAPYIENGIEKAAIQLLDFGKTEILNPGDSVKLEITFDPAFMASYDETAVKRDGTAGAWVLDQGDYYFTIGNGAHEALNNILAKKTGSTDKLVKTAESDVISAENVVAWTLNAKDIETYSVNVQNALQDMDINKLIPGTVEYTTRADWTKGWNAVTQITPTEEMMVGLTNSSYTLNANGEGTPWGVDHGLKLVDFMVLDEETGLCVGVRDWEDPSWDELVEQITLEEAIAFVEKGGEDFEALNSIMCPAFATNDGPVGYTFDQMSGYHIRWNEFNADEPTYVTNDTPYAKYAMNNMPTEPVVAATFNKELVEREGELFGEDSLWANSNEIAGPGLNLHRAPYCARNHEYYSEDSVLTSLMGEAVCKGGQKKGIDMEPKHFAFNHQELNRSGLSTFMTEQAARELELRGFQGALAGNYADGVMTGFNRAGTVFSGAHSGMLEQILRKEWGYDGWVVTDMINGADYMNWRDNIAGGGLVCLTSNAYDESLIGPMAASTDAIKADTHFQLKMKEGLRYYLYTVASNNVMNGISSDSHVVHYINWWQWTLIAVNAALLLITIVPVVKYFTAARKGAKKA